MDYKHVRFCNLIWTEKMFSWFYAPLYVEIITPLLYTPRICNIFQLAGRTEK